MIGLYLFSIFGLSEDFLQTWETFRWGISSAIFFIVLLFLYKLAPHKRIYFKTVIIGTAFATISWQFVSLVFSFYVITIGDYSATYGSLGVVIILMFWFYLFGIIIILGGVLNAFIEKVYRRPWSVKENSYPLKGSYLSKRKLFKITRIVLPSWPITPSGKSIIWK